MRRTELKRRHLLFLGHGLNVPDLHKIIEFAKSPKRTLQRTPGESTPIQDLAAFGLVPIVRDLAESTAQLHTELAALG